MPKIRKIDKVTVKELARVIEPEAWEIADECDAKNITPPFDVNLKCVQSHTIAFKVLKYLQD